MHHVYYILLGVLAFAGIGLMAVAIFKLVMFIGDKITKRYEKPNPSDAVKSGLMTPNEVRLHHGYPKAILPDKATKPKQPHKHMWKFDWNHRDVIYYFTCECGEGAQIRIDQFWGSPTIRSDRALKRAELLYANKKAYEKERERAIAAFKGYPW